MSVSVKGNKPKRGFFYVQGGRELFVPRKYLSRFFREWDFPTRIDDVRKMKYHLEQYVGSYNPNTSKIAFVRDEEDYMNLYLAPLNETLIGASEQVVDWCITDASNSIILLATESIFLLPMIVPPSQVFIQNTQALCGYGRSA